jgi:hypothetical protein
MHQDFSVARGQTYYYRVCAESWAGGDSGWSNVTSVITPEPPVPPNSPSNVTAEWVSARYVQLVWNDNSTTENDFIIQRRAGSSGEWLLIKRIGPNATTYEDLSVAAGQTYYYRVCATSWDGGDSAWSNEATPTLATATRSLETPSAFRSASVDGDTGQPSTSSEALSDLSFVSVASMVASSESAPKDVLGDFANQSRLVATFDEQASSPSLGSSEEVPTEIPTQLWTNPRNLYDVNDDSQVTPLDVLLIANYMYDQGAVAALPSRQFVPPRFLDVTGDHLCAPQDALLVVNYIERTKSGVPEGEDVERGAGICVGVASESGVPPTSIADAATLESSDVSWLPQSLDVVRPYLDAPAAIEAPTDWMTTPVESLKTAVLASGVDLLEWDDSFLAELKGTAWGADILLAADPTGQSAVLCKK